MKKLSTVLIISLAILLLNGCIEEKNEYFVNPNGSGKVVHEVFSVEDANLNFGDSGSSEPDIDQQLKEMAQEVLLNSKGIETWSDIVIEVTDEGKLHFNGTAYFKDITKVSFEKENVETNAGLSIRRSNEGLIILEMIEEDDDKKEPASTNELTAEQVKQQIKQQRLKYNQSKPLIEGVLANMKETTVVHYMGRLKESINFQQTDGAVSLTFDGKQMLEYMNATITDDDKMEQIVRTGKSIEDNDWSGFFESIGGEPKTPRAVIEPTAPLFNYEKEVAQAKAKYPEMIKSLNLSTAAQVTINQPEVIGGTEIQDVRIGGVCIVHFIDTELSYQPFGRLGGYNMSFIGKLPLENLQIHEGHLTKALSLDGKNLLPQKDTDRSLKFLKVAKDGVSISFEAETQIPDKNAKGFSEIAGVLQGFRSEGVKEIDLGLMELKEGATNEAEGISIRKAGKMDWGDDYEIELKLRILKHLLKDIRLYNEDGSEIETSSSGSMSSGGFLMSKGIRVGKKLPEKGRIVIELYDNLEQYEILFTLKNISLIGQPLD